MPVYIISWTGGECMLVRCRDEDDHIDRLDQFDNRAEATWQIYKGRFAISLRLWINREEDEYPLITYAADLEGEEAVKLGDAVSRFAFPMTFRAQEELNCRIQKSDKR